MTSIEQSQLEPVTEVVVDAHRKKATHTKAKSKRVGWKKPKGKPRRPLSAYNLFFQNERKVLLGEKESDDKENESPSDKEKRIHRKTHGKVGFSDMAKIIGAKWKSLDAAEKETYSELAKEEKARYFKELEVWKATQRKKDETSEHTNTIEAKEKPHHLATVQGTTNLPGGAPPNRWTPLRSGVPIPGQPHCMYPPMWIPPTPHAGYMPPHQYSPFPAPPVFGLLPHDYYSYASQDMPPQAPRSLRRSPTTVPKAGITPGNNMQHPVAITPTQHPAGHRKLTELSYICGKQNTSPARDGKKTDKSSVIAEV